jgi:hypothetical protein
MNGDDINAVLGNYAGGVVVQVGDKLWKLEPATKRIQGEYLAWLKMQARVNLIRDRDRALEEAQAARKAGDDDLAVEYQRLVAQCNKDLERLPLVIASKFAWGGDEVNDSLNDQPGAFRMIYLMLRANHPELTYDQVEALIYQDPTQFALAMREALHLGDPNRFPPPPRRKAVRAGGGEIAPANVAAATA